MTPALARTAEDLSTLDDHAIVRYVLLELARRRLTPDAEEPGYRRALGHARALLRELDVKPLGPPAPLAGVVDLTAWRARRAS